MAEIVEVEVSLTGPATVASVVILDSPGADGADGEDGAPGADGVGIPAGGTTGQVLKKSSGTDYATEWGDESGGSGGVSDGDKGDITVSSSGTVWTIDAAAVTLAKMANLAASKLIGRYTGSTGVPETITVGTDFSLSGGTLSLGVDPTNASLLSTGTLPDGRFPATLPAASGANLTALNATNLASGTVPDARFPATLPAASGANLTALNASNLSSGTIPIARVADGDVTLAKLANLAQSKLIGRYTSSTGVPETITVGSDFSLSGGTLALSANPANASNLTTGTIGAGVTIPWEIQLAASDETTALTTGTAKVTFRMPWAATLTSVRASVTTAPTGSTLVVDINENTGSGATTILSTKLSIDASEKTSTTAATAAVISDTALADDAEITIDIDQIGSSVAGAGLKITLKGTRTI